MICFCSFLVLCREFLSLSPAAALLLCRLTSFGRTRPVAARSWLTLGLTQTSFWVWRAARLLDLTDPQGWRGHGSKRKDISFLPLNQPLRFETTFYHIPRSILNPFSILLLIPYLTHFLFFSLRHTFPRFNIIISQYDPFP